MFIKVDLTHFKFSRSKFLLLIKFKSLPNIILNYLILAIEGIIVKTVQAKSFINRNKLDEINNNIPYNM